MEKLKVLELFSGIGAQHKALTNLGIDCECTQCDIDKYAVQSYNAVHGQTTNLGDISLIKEEELYKDQWDLVTYSSPCQDFSFAGLQAGGEKGSGTRSSLLWEVEKVIRAVRPKYLLMENVKALVSKKFKPCFDKWIETLNSYGYQTKWQVLNAKNYGIPQNRERVFAVSIRNDIEKDFQFPEGKPLTIRLKDILEEKVDERYYLSDEIQKRFKYKPQGENVIGTTKPDFRTIGRRDDVFSTENCINAIITTDYKQPKQIYEPVIVASRGRNPDNPSDRTTGSPTEQRLEVNSQGIANTLTSVLKDNWVAEPKVIELNKDGKHQQDLIQDANGICRCIPAGTHGSTPHLLKTMVEEPQEERMTKQAFETLKENVCKDGDVINPFNKRVVNDGVCPTITTRPEGFKTANLIVEEPKLNQVDIIQKVKVRKYEVDIEGLKVLLRNHKKLSGKSNEEIATLLNKPLTNVEHWFRNDSCFSIPSEDIWYKLKDILGIKTIDYDAQITEFIEKDGEYDIANRAYESNGLSPTITTVSTPNVIEEPKLNQVGSLDIAGNDCIKRVYDKDGISPTLTTMEGGNRQPKVYGDNTNEYRIRKLTPKECWRLMGFSDEDFDKAKASGVSNCQLYKQAGNSIVVNVLMGIFDKLLKG